MNRRRPSTPLERRIGGQASAAPAMPPRTLSDWYRELSPFVAEEDHDRLLAELADTPVAKLERHFGPLLVKLRSARQGGR